jgi:hypothetical protein
MTGNWKESTDRVVHLSEDQPKVFAIYLEIIYNNTYRMVGLKSEFIARVFVLAEKLKDFDIKKLAIHAIVAKRVDQDKGPTVETIAIIYAGTAESDSIRSLCVDIYLHSDFASYVAKNEAHLPREFLLDLALGFMEWKQDMPGRSKKHKFDPANYVNEEE